MRTRTFSSLPLSLSLVLAAGLGFAGCDKSDTSNPPPADTGGDVAADGGAADGAAADGEVAGEEGGDDGAEAEATWATMDRGARLEHMGTVVLPKMKEGFKAQGYDTFKCGNCHGEDYKSVDFAMPNDLTPLNADDPIQSGMDLDEETTKFMVSFVLPEMATLLGMETDVTTGKGEFGCLSCHLAE